MTPSSALLADAQMITADAPRAAAVRFVRNVPLDRDPSLVDAATFVATAHGCYEARINGHPVDDAVLAPGWTAYEWRLAFQEYDVTDLVRRGGGPVALEVLVGNGWFRGGLGPWRPLDYGDEIGLLGALDIRYADGHRQVVPTSTDWTARSSEVTENSLYNGQTIDARLRGRGRLLPVRAKGFDGSALVPQSAPHVRRIRKVQPVRLWTDPSGATIVDFGQNIVGWVRFGVSGPAGTEISVRHAEALEEDQLATAPLRGARATDVFILSGEDDEFEPTLTFHGFRYVAISGWPGELGVEDLEAVVVGSDLRRTGGFECSDPRVNRLVENSVWSQTGNFFSVPTDCPQRDERLGWTGDIAVYAPTAAFQFDVGSFLDSWLDDLAAEATAAGGVPWVVPDVIKLGSDHDAWWNSVTAVWGDAAVWVPEALWTAYGNVDRLRRHYPIMVAHLESVERLVSPSGLWDAGFQFGDWLDPDAPPHDAQQAKADPSVVATACLYRSARFAAEAARILDAPDHARWSALADRTRAAFNDAYVADGRVHSDCATVYALSLQFGLLEEGTRPAAARRLAELVREADHRATTGFVGTPYVTWALSENGYVDDAYGMLLQDEVPSWLYQVATGATTMWERWDSVLPDGTLNDPVMTSLNHYAFGAVCDWIYQVIGGIRPALPGYARVLVQPRPGVGIDWATCFYDSDRGRIDVSWRIVDGRFTMDVEVPEGLEADILLPDGGRHAVAGGSHSWTTDMPADLAPGDQERADADD